MHSQLRSRTSLVKGLLWCVLLVCSLVHQGQAAVPQTAVLEDIDRAEQLGWSDPEKALHRLDQLESVGLDASALEQLLVVRGFLLIDTRQDGVARTLIEHLYELGHQHPSARLAAHMVQTYQFSQHDQVKQAVAELGKIEPDGGTPASTLYRLESLKGSVLRFTGQHEAAVLAYERAIDIADSMHSRSRKVAALVHLVYVLEKTGNLEAAATRLRTARELATEDGDEAALAIIARNEAEVADRRNDRQAERRAALEELEHARKAASTTLLALAFADLGDSYMKTGEFARSLEYTRQAGALAPYISRPAFESTVQFNTALAQIGLGNLHDGKPLADQAIQHTIQSGNLVDANDLMREYGQALERAGDLRGALQAYHRGVALRDQLMSAVREQALLELSGKFDAERRTREIELLKRDNAIQTHDLRAQRLQQQTILIATGLIGLACAALAWAFSRIRKANARLRFESQHDALTALHNRRYFNEQVLVPGGGAPFRGCVLLIDLDHFKRVNDTFGHPAGDAILAAVGNRMTKALRARDLLVRWGGEEFLALLDPMSDAELNATTHRILNAMREEPVSWNGQKIHCTVSIGCARFPMRGTAIPVSLERAIGLVDKALYEAKRRGRNRACLLTVVAAQTEQDLAEINADFAAAAADRKVLLVETITTGPATSSSASISGSPAGASVHRWGA
jgi:diguanylate cyclase (GGDEF)-like protein